MDVGNSTCSALGVATSSPRNLNCRMNNLSLPPFLPVHSFSIAHSSRNPSECGMKTATRHLPPSSSEHTASDPPRFCSGATFAQPHQQTGLPLQVGQDTYTQPDRETRPVCGRSAAYPLAGCLLTWMITATRSGRAENTGNNAVPRLK